MFRGPSNITLDSKNRITIPTKYRETLAVECEGKMIATVHSESRCLLLYPLSEWELLEAKLNRLSDMHPAERNLKRILLGNATECELDKNGRLLLNSTLRQYANLDKSLMLIGMHKKFEIWNEADWFSQMQQGLEDHQSGKHEPTEQLLELSL